MPPKKRTQSNSNTRTSRRQSKRSRPSELAEMTPDTVTGETIESNITPANMMMVDVQALTTTISVAVSQAVKQAFEQAPQAQVQNTQGHAREVEAVVEEEISTLARGTATSITSTSPHMPSSKQPFASIAVALGSTVSSKLKSKIWANEYINFGALISISPNSDKYSLSFNPATSSSNQPQLNLEPYQPTKKINSFSQWLSAFNTFAAVYSERFPNEAPKLMKYCEIIRDISAKPGDWSFYDEQFRYIRQSAPDQYPWDAIHWELWLKAVINFRGKPQFNSERVYTGSSTRARPRQSFPKGSCWTFHSGRYCSGCRFEHICFKCGSKHPASQCSATQPQRAAFPNKGPAAANSAQQASHPRKGGQA